MWLNSKQYHRKLIFLINYTSSCKKYHPATNIIVIWTSYSGSLTPQNIILDTRIIKIFHVEQKIWNKVDSFIFGATILKKIQYGHHEELIAVGTPSKIDHNDLP